MLFSIENLKNFGFGVLAVLGLMVMITVHEFGHYIVGKIFKFKINEFAIGMGPAIYKRTKKNGEVFSVRALPLGGYCAFEGEDEENPSENAFNNKAPWKRILVLLAGATMNYLLALVIIIVSTNVYGASTLQSSVVRQSAEYTESLQSGDYILSIKNGDKKTDIVLSSDLVSAVNHSKKGDLVYAEIIRNTGEESEYLTVPVRLREDVECKNLTEVNEVYSALGIGSAMQIVVRGDESGALKTGDYIIGYKTSEESKDYTYIFDYEDFKSLVKDKTAGDKLVFYVYSNGMYTNNPIVLGEAWESVDKENEKEVLSYFRISSYEYSYYTGGGYLKVGFFRSIPRSINYSVKIGGTILKTLGELISGKLGIRSVGGTVTTIVATTKIIRYGLVYALEIFSFIGVNLAVFNLLPIPALDGSRIVFCIIEWIRKKPVDRKVEGIIHAIGFIFILGFAVLVDLLQFI